MALDVRNELLKGNFLVLDSKKLLAKIDSVLYEALVGSEWKLAEWDKEMGTNLGSQVRSIPKTFKSVRGKSLLNIDKLGVKLVKGREYVGIYGKVFGINFAMIPNEDRVKVLLKKDSIVREIADFRWLDGVRNKPVHVNYYLGL